VEDQSFAAGLVGVVLDGRYRLDALLGEGGMGAVFRAHHLAMDRKVAVKLLKPHLTSDEIATQRFLREARATIKVESPHAVKVLDFGVTPFPENKRDYYMVLEYLDGRTVQRELDIDGPFTPARVVHIAKQSLHALGAAHRSGLIHRDVKPDNLLLMRVGDDPDYAKVLDFGVAKLMAGWEQSEKSQLALTQAGMVFGTPEFMSPEQACGLPLDGRSDLYSLAATMFAMLTGCGMYVAKSPIEWLTHHARTPPPHLGDGNPELARFDELDALLQRCLAKHREQRPETADEMVRMLDAVEPTLTRRPGQVVGKATLAPRKLKSAPSSYFAVLPNETLVDPTKLETLPPPTGANAATMLPTTTGMLATTAAGSRRGVWLALGALVVVATVGIAVALATRHDASTIRDAAAPVIAPAPAAPADAGNAPADASKPLDATAEIPHGGSADISHTGSGGHAPRSKAEAARHLAAAEEAVRAGNRMKQLTEADLALRADPRSVRAKFLLGDALINYGDTDKGCKYLRELKGNATAKARMAAAACPTN
jgi:serine/threonine protein kinase